MAIAMMAMVMASDGDGSGCSTSCERAFKDVRLWGR